MEENNKKELTAYDLMIGDWVRNCNGKNKRVEQILKIGVVLNYNGTYFFDDIEPIPITEEILLKNGFKKKMGGTFEMIYNTKCKYLIINYNPISGLLSANNLWFRANDIHYVHELQHALRYITDKIIEL